MEATVTQMIKGFRADIRIIDREHYLPKQRAHVRVFAWNWLTSPSRPMSDQEHRVCRKMARKMMAFLKTMPEFWFESDSGRLWVKP